MIFASPTYLLGLLLVVVPIILHFWFRKRLRKIPFSSLALLHRTEIKRLRWLRLRELLILLLRCLFIVFLVLSLARPRSARHQLSTGQPVSCLLVVDNTWSMAYGDNLARACRAAHRVVDHFARGSDFLVIPLCPLPGDTVIGFADADAAHRQIDLIALGYERRTITDVLARTPLENLRRPLVPVYVGDGQIANFSGLAPQSGLVWVAIDAGSNVGIQRVFPADPLPAPGQDRVELRVEVRNHGPHSWTGKVVMEHDGDRIQQECHLEPRKSTFLSFLVPIETDRCRVTLDADSCPPDNVYYFAQDLSRRARILVIGDGMYLATALAPLGEVRGRNAVNRSPALGNRDIRDQDVVILDGSSEISTAELLRLENYRDSERGAILVLLGSQIGPNLRALIQPCFQPTSLAEPAGYATIAWLDTTFVPFRAFPDYAPLQNIKFYRYWQGTAVGPTVARLTQDQPLIVVAAGMTVIATRFEPGFTDAVFRAAFVPLAHRLVEACARRPREKEFRPGDEVPETEGAERFTEPGFHSAAGDTVAVNITPDEGDLTSLSPGSAQQLGIRRFHPETLEAAHDLERILLFAALLCLVLETLLLVMR